MRNATRILIAAAMLLIAGPTMVAAAAPHDTGRHFTTHRHNPCRWVKLGQLGNWWIAKPCEGLPFGGEERRPPFIATGAVNP